jgi:hypothetical protein
MSEPAQPIVLQVKKGVKYIVEEVDEVLDGATAHITTSDETKLRVSVKQLAPKVEGFSSRVVDVTMCG